jgi:replicative DNA helicase
MDYTLLEHEMRALDHELYAEMNGLNYVGDGLLSVVDDVHVTTYADLIVEEYQRNSLRLLAMEISGKCGSRDIPVEQILQLANSKLEEIAGMGVNSTSTRQISEIGQEVVARHTRLLENGGTSVGYSTGLKGMDNIMGGFMRGEVAIASALTSHGKTALSLHMAVQIALQNIPVYIISLEMSMEQLYGRILMSMSDISPENLRMHGLTETEIAVAKSLNEDTLRKLPIYIDYIAAARPEDIRAKVKLARKRKQCDFLVLDYINQLDTGHAQGENLATSLGHAMKRIKDLAVEENIPALVLAQMNREIEHRAGKAKIPILSDLRNSGVIEQTSDVVMFVYRPDRLGITKDEDTGENLVGIAKLLLLKNRNGGIGHANFRHNKTFTKLWDFISFNKKKSKIQQIYPDQ